MTTIEGWKEENRRHAIVGLGAILVLVGGLTTTSGDAPIYGFFAYVVGILFTRWAFRA